MAETLTMSQKERDRGHILRQVVSNQLTVPQATQMLAISERHCYRLLRAYRQCGDAALIHRLRGRTSNRGYDAKEKTRILELYRTRFPDYGPVLFAETLLSLFQVTVSKETLRQWLLVEGLWKRARKGRRHRKKRPRREHIGDMVQVDGSHHTWFEHRGPACCLFVFIDDASNRSLMYFSATESEHNALHALWRYIVRYGIPHQIYLDRHGVYFSATSETNFARVLRILGIEIIHAHSPQAKGRVERANRTQQDRLVKALREAGISDIDRANAFLDAGYQDAHNARFAHTDQVVDVHRPVAGRDLKNIVCLETQRTVYHDMTFQFQARFFQILPAPSLLPVPRQRVTVRHWLDGSMHVFWREQELAIVPCAPDRPRKPPPPVTPADTHPWRQKLIGKARSKSIAELCRR